MSLSESNLIYNQINSAIGYTFNKAHAVAYGYLTYYIAYLKANFFPELITYFLNKKKEKNLSYLQEAFFYEFQIKGPDINLSQTNLIRKKQELIMGFNSLKEYRVEFFQRIIEEREKGGLYKNWENFLSRTIHYWENIEVIVFEAWTKSGLFRSLQVDVESLLENRETIFRYLKIRQKISVINNNLPFFNLPVKKGEINKLTVNKREYESLGLYISYFSNWKELALKTDYKLSCLLDIFQKIEDYNDKVTLINVYSVISQVEKKDERNYSFVLQDIRNSFKLNIGEDIYQANKEILVNHNELLFTLKVEVKEGKFSSLVCEKIRNI